MLDAETKRRIDGARDVLVGQVPDPKGQVEQITMALLYKFMDAIDKEAVENGGKPSFFVGNSEKFAWSELMREMLDATERFTLYRQGVEGMSDNTNLPDTFRDIFKGAFLSFNDPRTLRLFLTEVDGIQYTHSEDLGDAFEYLLSILGSQGDAGQFRTPRHIIDFIVEVVSPKKNERILDPACGTAGFLISAQKHIYRENSTNGKNLGDKLTPAEKTKLANNIVGYDIAPDMVRLSLTNMFLHGLKQPQVREYDTLTSDAFWEEDFDVILANPPFMSPRGGIIPHKRFAVKANRSEVLFVDYIAEHLSLNGRAGIIVPEGIVFQSAKAYKSLRKNLVGNWGLWAVVSLPQGVFNPYAGVKTSILFIDKQLAKKTDEILFVKVENDGFDLGAQRRKIDENDLPDCLQILEQWKKDLTIDENSQFAFSVSKSTIAENGGYDLTGDRYRETVDYSNVKWQMVALGEVCEIESGSRQKGGSLSSGIPSIGGEQIDADGSIKLEKMRHISEEHFNSMKKGVLKKGDVLIVKDGATTGKSGYLNNQFEKGAVNEHVFILRARQNVLPYYLYSITKNSNFQNDLKPYIKGIIGGISLEIKKIKIPLPPLEVQKEIVAEIEQYQKIIDGAKQVVDNWKPQIKINPDWEMVELGEVCESLFAGGDVPKDYSKTKIDGYEVPIYTNGIGNKGLYGFAKKARVKQECVTLSARGTIGYPEIRKIPFYPAIRLIVAIPKSMVLDTIFLKYALVNTDINRTGNTIPQLTVPMVKSIKIPLPPLEAQKEIVDEIEAEQKSMEGCKKLLASQEQKINNRISEVWE